jgi:hypothetical protein
MVAYEPVPPTEDANVADGRSRSSIPVEGREWIAHGLVSTTAHPISPQLRNSTGFALNQADANGRAVLILPLISIIFLVTSGLVLYSSYSSSCSQPLHPWLSIYVFRNVSKSVLYRIRSDRISSGSMIPKWLLFSLAVVDLSGPTLWALGGFYLFNTDTCSQTLYVYSLIVWTLQTVILLLPICFLSTIIFCAPFLLWLAPYIVTPNPNTVSTAVDVISKLPVTRVAVADAGGSCSVCLGDYQPEQEVMTLPCEHFFHSICVQEWLKISQLCPMCRGNVVQGLETQLSQV